MNTPETGAVEKLAHELWIGRGRPEGSPEQDWFRAEQMLRTPTAQEKSKLSPRLAKKVRKVVPDDNCDG